MVTASVLALALAAASIFDQLQHVDPNQQWGLGGAGSAMESRPRRTSRSCSWRAATPAER